MYSPKKIMAVLLSMLALSVSVYYFGCASAESTTGKLAFKEQDYQKAEVELKKGLLIDQNDDEGWYMLGYSEIELGKFDDAKNSFKKSLSISNNFGEQIRQYWIQKFNAGASAFKNGIDLENKKDSVGARGYYENALKSFEASSAIIPDSLKSWSAIGETYLALGQEDKALQVFNDIVSKSSTKENAEKVAKILFESGLTMMTVRNYPSAVQTFKKVLSIESLPKNDPYYETSAYNAALGLAKMGEDMRKENENSNYKEKFSESLTYLKPLTESLTKKDLEPQIYDLLVSVYANLGMTQEAQDALKKKEELKK